MRFLTAQMVTIVLFVATGESTVVEGGGGDRSFTDLSAKSRSAVWQRLERSRSRAFLPQARRNR